MECIHAEPFFHHRLSYRFYHHTTWTYRSIDEMHFHSNAVEVSRDNHTLQYDIPSIEMMNIIHVIGDGNCQLYSLGDQELCMKGLPYNEETVKQRARRMRVEICNSIRDLFKDKPDVFKQHKLNETNETLADWLVRMKRINQWGDEMFLLGYSLHHMVNIFVYHTGGLITPYIVDGAPTSMYLQLQNKHYSSLRPK